MRNTIRTTNISGIRSRSSRKCNILQLKGQSHCTIATTNITNTSVKWRHLKTRRERILETASASLSSIPYNIICTIHFKNLASKIRGKNTFKAREKRKTLLRTSVIPHSLHGAFWIEEVNFRKDDLPLKERKISYNFFIMQGNRQIKNNDQKCYFKPAPIAYRHSHKCKGKARPRTVYEGPEGE
jgi:hypothetical protein